MDGSDADKIRNKRLAKLGGGNSSGSQTTQDATAPSQPQPAPSPAPAATGPPKPSIPSAMPTVKPKAPAAQAAPKINISSGLSTLQQHERDGPRIKQPRLDGPSVEEWEDRTLAEVFRITLHETNTHDAHRRPLFCLKGLKADLADEGHQERLTTHHLDQALTEAGARAAASRENLLTYLLGCWKRICRVVRGMRSTEPDNPRYIVAKEARRICMSYCIFACTMPEMFEAPTWTTNPMTDHLLEDPESDRGIDLDFLSEITARFEEDDSNKELMVAAVEQLSERLSVLSLTDDYKPHMLAMRNLVRYPKIVHGITESTKFLGKGSSTTDIETHSTLGPFFRISPLQPTSALTFFPEPRTMDRGASQNAKSSIRLTLQTHQGELFDIANIIVKTAKDPRERILDWFALIVNSNHKRRAMRIDPKSISTDGFLLNVTAVLDQLCEPFIDASFSKIDRIDVNYLRRHPRVSIRDETKINADQKTSDDFYDHQVGGENNFISELFFLTVAAHHYGTEAINAQMSKRRKELKYFEEDVDKFEQKRGEYINQPRLLPIFEQRLKTMKEQLDGAIACYNATDGALADELAQTRSMHFMRYVILFQLRLATGQNLPKEQLTLPLPDTIPDAFKCLPEYFLEDIVDNFKFLTSNMPWIFTNTQSEEIIRICVTFLRSSEYVKSPYLKSGLVSILSYGVHPFRNSSQGVLGDLLNGMEFCHKHLLHALMKFYIEAESTGLHSQFYDKFNIRYEIDTVIKAIWPNVIYRDNLAKEASVNTDFFVRFVNLLLNDVTYVLDESFTSFHKIHDLSRELANASGMEETERKDKEAALAEHKGRAKSYMGLTNETISMLKLFTEALATAFTMPEVVQRLADMLDYNIDALTGPKRTNLVVENPAEYGFDPKAMLSDLIDVYLNLRNKEAFHLAVARDGRSYKPANFQKAAEIMERFAYKSRDELLSWAALQKAIAEAHAADQQAEEDLGEIPDELLDPIMGSLMEDPVLLPSSKQIVDRSTIRSHLLSDPTDPFNRVPLKIEEVVDAVEKRKEIQDFIASKRGEKMDTSA